VRRSFFRCSEVSVVDVCACTIKSPISRIFDGRFRKAVRMTDRRSGPHCQSRKLANAPTRQPGPLSLPFSFTLRTFRCSGDLPTDKLLRQPDLVYTVQDALALISQPQSVQVEPSDPSKASQQVTVLIETFPPVLIVYLKRFLYDIVAGGVVKNCKPVQFSPGLKIPPGTFFFSLPRGSQG
jgi:hypothetical protein